MATAQKRAGSFLSSLKAFAFSFRARFSRSDILFCSGVYGTTVSKVIPTSLTHVLTLSLMYSPALSQRKETIRSFDSFSTRAFHSLKMSKKLLLRRRKKVHAFLV